MNYNKIKKYIINNNYGRIDCNNSFKHLTSLRIGGNIPVLYYPNNIKSLINVIKRIKKYKFKYFIIGNGSNILAEDKEYEGIVISLKEMDFKYKINNDNIIVNSGMKVSNLIVSLMKKNIGGLEFLIGIPGTIGGLIYMNAGAYKKEMKDIVLSVKCLDNKGNIIILNNKDLNFSYRSSIIKEKNWIILESTIKIVRKEKEEIKEQLKKYLLFRKNNQPLNNYNAGCTFKNSNISSWKLIDEVGLRGYSINDAKISMKHSNFLVNCGNAKYIEMIQLINYIKKEVKDKKNIDLDCEWIFIK